ncbi:MAG TPA: 23S rRNA (adenine(2503)-C(2))-methyltransferase RlmN, partial [Nitrospiraceae bacterium]|nr:23S rRNA (adenine(2503)-C(2))-methyltransferase RlmN [Nitrospiraceae bacterium]
MTSLTSLLNLLALRADELSALTQELGWPRYRANQILRWLYQHRAVDIESMTNLSKTDRARLQEVATIHRMGFSPPTIASDGTAKFVWNLEDGLAVETILIPDGRRRTLCLSSQVGCTLDCG